MPSERKPFSQRLIQHWYAGDAPKSGDALGLPMRAALLIVCGIYWLLWQARKLALASFLAPAKAMGVRVIAVGNLVAGGAGKTPCVIALGQAAHDQGLGCGLLFRGYRSGAEHGPVRVVEPSELPHTSADEIGDEAWLACWRTQLPIAVGSNRFQALQALRKAHPEIRTVILDDGLQQRHLNVDERVLVTDARGFGNQHLLPAGPLREPIGQLDRFDAWIHQTSSGAWTKDALAASYALPKKRSVLEQTEVAWVPLAHWQQPDQWLDVDRGVELFRGQRILAAAGIAVPERFFLMLQSMGLRCHELALADHDPNTVDHIMQAQMRDAFDVILMTEKDAVKFFVGGASRAPQNAWALRRDAQLDNDFVKRLIDGHKTS